MTPARKTTVRRVPDGHFRQWHVTYACGCPAHDAPKGGDQPNNLAGLWRAAGNAVQWRAA